jgi:hypothetical protein
MSAFGGKADIGCHPVPGLLPLVVGGLSPPGTLTPPEVGCEGGNFAPPPLAATLRTFGQSPVCRKSVGQREQSWT